MDWKTALEQARGTMTNTYDGVQSGMLNRLGLEPKRSTMEMVLPALGVFGAGIAVGAALGVIFAPKRGQELRHDISHRLSDMRDRGVEQIEEVRFKGAEQIDEVLAKGEEIVQSARSRVNA